MVLNIVDDIHISGCLKKDTVIARVRSTRGNLLTMKSKSIILGNLKNPFSVAKMPRRSFATARNDGCFSINKRICSHLTVLTVILNSELR